MIKRIIVGIVGIPLLLYVILSNFYYCLPFLLFLILLNGLALNEIHYIFSLKNVKINRIYFITCGILMIISLYIQLLEKICATSFILLLTSPLLNHLFNLIFLLSISIYFISLIFNKDYKDVISKISYFIFGLFYISYLSGYFLLLKSMPDGRYFLFLIILLIWSNDTFAYFGGMLFGKKKLKIKASPNKSYAGIYFGIIFSIISVFISELIFKTHISLSLLQKLFIGFVFGIIVILSDLMESVLKRSAGIKDSKSLFPGHGGVLDIFDGWFLTIPLFYFYIIFFII